jgi:hypothetical protein
MTTGLAQRSPIALRNCRWIFVAAWAALFLPWTALAQPSLPSPGPDQAIPPSPSESQLSAEPASTAASVTVRGPCDPDYWIISTRDSKHQVDHGHACDYDVIRFDGPNPGRGSTLNELLASLQPGVPVCFMTHGSFVTRESMLRDSARTYHWLRSAAPCQPVHIIFYSWASDEFGCIPELHVKQAGNRASCNGFYLAELISMISPDHPICLIGHSHGTRIVASALHVMAGGVVERRVLTSGAKPPRRLRVVFAAAAIDHDWLNPNKRFGRALCQAEAVINLRNSTDFPLMFYTLRHPTSSRAMAITGLTCRDRKKLGEWNERFLDYDVTDMIGYGHIWKHYYSHPEIAAAIRHYIYFDDVPVDPDDSSEAAQSPQADYSH